MMKRASSRWYGTIVVLIMPLLMVFSTQAQEGKTFKAEELDQMLAPIALYPDSNPIDWLTDRSGEWRSMTVDRAGAAPSKHTRQRLRVPTMSI